MKDAVEQGYKLAVKVILYYYRQLVQVLIGIAVLKNVAMILKTVFICCKKGDTINETYHYFRWWHWWTYIPAAITIYKEIMKQNPDAQVLYVGTEKATLV